MTVVAIHQPNYLPWLGYFHKVASADVFVFLDDAQFSKNSFINRVRVLSPSGARWLTVPVSARLGTRINDVPVAAHGWEDDHQRRLASYYAKAPCAASVLLELATWYRDVSDLSLAEANIALVQRVAAALSLTTDFVRSSELGLAGLAADERLAAIAATLAPGSTYLSGAGGRSYQREEIFAARDVSLRYQEFRHPEYPQASTEFVPGLSVVDAACAVGWEAVADIVRTAA